MIKKYRVRFIIQLVVLFSSFALFNDSVWAAKLTNKSHSETYQNIIEKAQNLILQKNRLQALDVLKNAAQKEQNLTAVKELKKTAIDIANIFMTEKTHQLYESALTLRFSNVNDATSRINEALKIEPNNIALMLELSRLLIAKKDCKAAETNAISMVELIPFYEKVDLSLAQAYQCQNNWEGYRRIVATINIGKSEDKFAWEVLEFENALVNNQLLVAQDLLKTLEKSNPDYPELPYLRWKMSVARQKPDNDQAQKYLQGCKNITMSVYRKYLSDSTLCRNILEVESEAKGLINVGE